MRSMMQVRRTKERASEIFPGLKKMLYSMISSGNMTSAGMTVKNFTFWGKNSCAHHTNAQIQSRRHFVALIENGGRTGSPVGGHFHHVIVVVIS